MNTAIVILFKPSGKYHTEEKWRIPDNAITPHDMARSPDFRRIAGGAVLVGSQEPWGYPHLFPQEMVDVERLQKIEAAAKAYVFLDVPDTDAIDAAYAALAEAVQ